MFRGLGLVSHAQLFLNRLIRHFCSGNGFFVAETLARVVLESLRFLTTCVKELKPALLLLKSDSIMSEDIDKHVLRKYHVGQKLGKGVSILPNALVCPSISSLSSHWFQ